MYRICIADDELYVRQSIVRRIESMRLDAMIVGAAEDGEAAARLYHSEKPDLFFVDIRMPGKDGLSFIQAVRQKDPDTGTRFVIVSGYDDFESMQKAIKAGVSDYIRKPFQQEEFEETVRAVCGRIDQEKQRAREKRNEEKKNYWESFFSLHGRELMAGSFLLIYKKGIRKYEEAVQLERICDPREWRWLWFHGIENALVLYHRETGKTQISEKISQTIRAFVVSCEGRRLDLRDMLTEMEGKIEGRFFTKIPYTAQSEGLTPYRKIKSERLETALENTSENQYTRCVRQILQETFSKREGTGSISAAFQAVITAFADVYIKNGCSLPLDLRQEFLPLALARYDSRDELERTMELYAEELNELLRNMEKKKDVVERIIEYMDRSYMEEISLTSLAGEFFLAPTYLAKKFKERTGCTVIQYLEERRIARAKELLALSGNSISEIAAMTGYSDSNYFARSFKRVCGITPREYRSRCQDSPNESI